MLKVVLQQAFAGLSQTGELDDETVELMNTPRCGVRDVVGAGATAKRKKRYALQGSRWRTDQLTYRITKYPASSRLSRDQIDEEVRRAFAVWSSEANLSFEPKSSGSVHIEIQFVRGEHGDGDPFDGPGGTLAHAFFPQFGGDAHFDDEEYWTINEYRGTNLFQTAAHEFGHSLGLAHSDVRDSLMAPFYRGWEPNFRLHQDDISAIQALYGEKTTETRPDTDGNDTGGGGNTDSGDDNPNNAGGGGGGGSGDNSDLCSDPSFDAIFDTENGNYYVFKGSNYWLLTEDNVAPGYPRKIADDWPGLPDNIDAAVTWPDNGMTFFFKGSEYWKFKNQDAEPGYPKDISDAFDTIPSNLDAAFVWGGNGKIYFFKNGEYWKFVPRGNPPVSRVYPRPLSNWDLPNNIIGAVQWSNKYTYFFTDRDYYRFNDRRFTIDQGDPPFPRPTGPWWFGCSSSLRRSSLQKDDHDDFVSLFDDSGDESRDVLPTDEDKRRRK